MLDVSDSDHSTRGDAGGGLKEGRALIEALVNP
jgi:hypothetical protein